MAEKKNIIGETRMMKCGMNATCIAYRSAKDLDIQFEDAYVDKDYEEKQKKKIDEMKYINSVYDYVPGGKQINEIINNTYREEIFVKNLFNNKTYMFQIITFPMTYKKNFNAFEYDESTGVISDVHCNKEICLLGNKRIWK